MSKRSSHLWESSEPTVKRSASAALKAQLALANSVLEAPSLTVDGIRYWSDRFYLNHVHGDPLPTSSSSDCSCGADQPPPLLSRERLVQSLDLKAAVMGTFVMDTKWTAEIFPDLVGPTATVPTLILHGDKKLTKCMDKQQTEEKKGLDEEEDASSLLSSTFYDSSQELKPLHQLSVRTTAEDNCSLKFSTGDSINRIPLVDFTSATLEFTEAKMEMKEGSSSDNSVAAGSFQTQAMPGSKVRVCTPTNGTATTPTSLPEQSTPFINVMPSVTPEVGAGTEIRRRGKHCHFTRILSTWKKTNENNNRRVSLDKTFVEEEASPCLETKRGVHHPKFMILMEKSGDVVVLVSTANLTRTRTIEGTWVQRFRPNQRYQQQQKRQRRQSSDGSASTGNSISAAPSKPSVQLTPNNDFGTVLQDFLERMDESASQGDIQIQDFFSRYIGFPLAELAQSFYFDKAQVHLVPVIPGDFPVSTRSKSKVAKFIPCYGRQRVQKILQNQTIVKSNKDRLILQPTSLGGNWKQCEMADVVKSYLNMRPDEQRGHDEPGYWDDEALLDRMDIIWPSRKFIRKANGKDEECDEGENPTSEKDDLESSFVFMSSQTFNSLERACISRFSEFQKSDPRQRPCSLVPHFKSIARVVTNQSVVRSHGFQTSAQEYLSWFLLTSACLSQGAQGKKFVETDPFATTKDSVKYANFELGVLFTSRIQNRYKQLYMFSPNQCSCHSMADPQKRMIHLPIPYRLRPKSYFSDEDDAQMQETPFFHEIVDGARCVGNMLITPYGIQQAKKLKNRAKKKRYMTRRTKVTPKALL